MIVRGCGRGLVTNAGLRYRGGGRMSKGQGPTCECNVLTASVVRWLWPKFINWCNKNLLDSAKSLGTNFQL